MLNLLDHFYVNQYKFKAGALATYGAMAGGARAAYALRNTMAELGMVVAPTGFSVPNVWASFDAEGKFTQEAAAASLQKFLIEFSFVATTLRDARANRPQ